MGWIYFLCFTHIFHSFALLMYRSINQHNRDTTPSYFCGFLLDLLIIVHMVGVRVFTCLTYSSVGVLNFLESCWNFTMTSFICVNNGCCHGMLLILWWSKNGSTCERHYFMIWTPIRVICTVGKLLYIGKFLTSKTTSNPNTFVWKVIQKMIVLMPQTCFGCVMT